MPAPLSRGWPKVLTGHSLLAILVIFACLVWLHSPALFQGRVLCDEDTQIILWPDRERIYRLAWGLESWSWWDPLPFLGMPRLANYQMGLFTPDAVYFALLPPQVAFRFFPILGDLCLWFSASWCLIRRVRPVPAILAAGFFVLSGDSVLNMGPPVKGALISLWLMLGFGERWLASGRPSYLWGLALATIWQVTCGTASFIFLHGLALPFLGLWIWSQADPQQRNRRSGIAILICLASLLLASPSLLPLTDYSRHGSRQLFSQTNFSESYRYQFGELWRPLVAESLLQKDYFPKDMGGYPMQATLSFPMTGLLLFTCIRLRHWGLGLLALLFLAQCQGEGGGLVWLVHQLAPTTTQFRGIYRFILVFSLISSWLMAIGLDWLWQNRRQRLAWALIGWHFFCALWVMSARIDRGYWDVAQTQPIPLPPAVPSGRLAVNFSKSFRPPLRWLNAPLAQGRATLFLPHVLSDRDYFTGLLYSQYGAEAARLLPKLAWSSTPVPPRRPRQPLMSSWGLAFLLEEQNGQLGWTQLRPSPRVRSLVQVVACLDDASQQTWAARSDWDATQVAGVSTAPPALGSEPCKINLLIDTPDHQLIETEGQASLVIVADNWDPGWQCELDGKAHPTLKADLALKACYVPAGRHRLEWHYRPPWLKAAAIYVSVGLLLFSLASWLSLKERGAQRLSSPS